jgi:hypothetical protein
LQTSKLFLLESRPLSCPRSLSLVVGNQQQLVDSAHSLDKARLVQLDLDSAPQLHQVASARRPREHLALVVNRPQVQEVSEPRQPADLAPDLEPSPQQAGLVPQQQAVLERPRPAV